MQGLRKIYGDSVAVDAVTLSLGKGEMVALLGPSGCGKTTTLRMVAGFVEPSAGRILLDGRDITHVPANQRDTGMVFQSYALFPHMTVRRNVAFGLRCRHLPEDEVRRRTAEAIELVGLGSFEERYPRQLSGGQQQRVALARVLVLRPKLLLFDEPLSNLDAKLRVQMRQEIRRLQKDVGITALFVTHDQDEASSIADRIAVMNAGRIEQAGTPAEIYNEPATRFVADFIGTSNLIDGVAETSGDGRMTFRADAGGVFAARGRASTGARGALCIRPEKVDICPPGVAGAREGIVRRTARTAGMMEYVVVLTDGPELTVQEQLRHGIAPREDGALVGVVLREEDTQFLVG
ncbi:ABC transporter ATP-binding protein [Elioraea sp.]|uniref:ABC transporter ATP-binding protein n=1 Tax=Elioraea sp. TaxID=2185103 RepID=UPI0025C43975|nr:ABC transporter ATP-binding protein [Elioraea sp.]